MSPILGILASQDYVRIPPSSYESIASATGTGSSGTITFSSIPSTYNHLQIRIMARATAGGNNIQLTLNSDTGTNYTKHNLGGNGSIVFANGDVSQNYISFDDFTTTSSDGANTMGIGIIDVHDYSSTTKNKTLRGFGGRDNNGSGNIKLHSGLWINTNAISSITLTHSGSNFSSSSVFSLYGIKGA